MWCVCSSLVGVGHPKALNPVSLGLNTACAGVNLLFQWRFSGWDTGLVLLDLPNLNRHLRQFGLDSRAGSGIL